MKNNLLACLVVLLVLIAGVMRPPRTWANHQQTTASSNSKTEAQDPKPAGQRCNLARMVRRTISRSIGEALLAR
jgi:hypothetical protein